MAKLDLNDVGNILTATAVINQNNARIEEAMDKTLSRDGTAPNEMNANFDMNNYRIYNLPKPSTETEPARLSDVKDLILGSGDVVIATEAEARAGVSNLRLMTPLRSQQHLESKIGTTAFSVEARPQKSSLEDRHAKIIDLQNDYGAKSNNIDDDTAAFNLAIAEANSSDFPIQIDLGGGVYRTDGLLDNITRPVVFISRGTREAVITPRNPGGFLRFVGDSQRVINSGLRNILIDGVAMPDASEPVVVVDWAQDFRFENTILANCWSGASIRQTGDITVDLRIDKLRGGTGFKAFGSGASRNGEIDKIDVLHFLNATFTGTYVPGVTSPVGLLCDIDGFVHTILGKLRVLSSRQGLYVHDSYGQEQKFVPSFLYFDVLESEDIYLNNLNFEAANNVNVGALYAGTSVSESGVSLGADVYGFSAKFRCESNWKHGVFVNGANHVYLLNSESFLNGQAGPGTGSGVHIASGDHISIESSLLGKNTAIAAYTETQYLGINNVGGTNVTASNVDFRGNATATHSGAIRFFNCPGIVTSPSSPVSTTSSPHSFVAGENTIVNLYSGTGLTVTVDGVVVGNASMAYYVPAGSTFNVTFGGTLIYTPTVMR